MPVTVTMHYQINMSVSIGVSAGGIFAAFHLYHPRCIFFLKILMNFRFIQINATIFKIWKILSMLSFSVFI